MNRQGETPKRIPGCESTNHDQCYGELWQCSACGKTVCHAEGTDDLPEFCDDCWATPDVPQGVMDTQAIIIPGQRVLQIACDCGESGGECGTWLELTADGLLAIEDTDGLRVSIMLPDWLDDVMRTALLAHT